MAIEKVLQENAVKETFRNERGGHQNKGPPRECVIKITPKMAYKILRLKTTTYGIIKMGDNMKLYTNEIDAIIENKIKPNMKMIYDMKTRGLTDRQISKGLGISTKMFHKAMEEYEELSEIYNQATQLLCSQLREVAFERALGTDGKVDKDGNAVGPDANLAVRLLEKLDPEFGKKETDKNVNVTVEHVIKQISSKRRKEIEEDEEEEEVVV